MRPQLGDLRVLTMNLWQRYGAWADRQAVLIDGLRALHPDLVAFQEVIKNEEYDQMLDLLGPEWHFAHQQRRGPEGMGISIASRWPISQVQEIDGHLTARTLNFPGGTLIAEVQAPEPIGPLLFVNHFPNWQLSFEYERELQTVAAARAVEERVSQHPQQVVLVGDLDADPEAASIRFLSGRQSLGEMSVCYRDAWESAHPGEPGHTFTPDNPLVKDQVVKGTRPFRDWPFRRIDYIFVRYGEHGGPALDIVACTRIFDEPTGGVQASDHFGLMADLTAPNF
jgi:endonuclease/exonuclease/phosphatase family metal-dependent hydrolase